MTTIDYPAAHSMDTTWYAVDRAGHVAVFETGENGHLPADAHTGYPDTVLGGWRPGEPADTYSREAFSHWSGCYLYDYEFDWISQKGVYHRIGVPAMPVHVDQLPPALRGAFNKTRLDTDFAQAERVQPCEHAECHYWGGPPPAYLASDGVTVRPLPGNEAAFWNHFVDMLPELEDPEQPLRRFEGVERAGERIVIRSIPGDPKAFWAFYARLSREQPMLAGRLDFAFPTPDEDFPAAHSMDSCWFAVDRDGRVGFFETGEAGAQPVRGLHARQAELARLRIGRTVPAGESFVVLRGRLLPYLKGGGMRHTFGGSEFPTLMFLDSLDPVRDALAAGQAVPVPAREGYAVQWLGLPDVEYTRLHADDPELCRGCFWRFEDLDESAGEGGVPRPNLARHGVFVFKALGGNASANPYGLHEAPAVPVHLDQLPPEVRGRLREVQFPDLSFADVLVFQPADHVPCTAYEGSYTDMRGRSHPLPMPEHGMPPDEDLQQLEELLGPADNE